jgi:hypothetical protein
MDYDAEIALIKETQALIEKTYRQSVETHAVVLELLAKFEASFENGDK